MDDPTTAGREGFGLMFYQARWYDPGLGRFSQADSIIPEQQQGTQAWDRFAYVNNSPVMYNDPTGHVCSDPEDPTPGCDGGMGTGSNGNSKLEEDVPNPTLTEKIMQGNIPAIVEILFPSHVGGRMQIELSFGAVVGLSGSVGMNVVYNRNSDELAGNIDWALEPGVGIGAGASGTGGLLIGWGSSSVNDVTQGFSGIISGTVAAEYAISVAASAPIERNGLHVDPYSGQLPVTFYIGGGGGGGYAGVGGGINGPTGIYANLTPLLPWHWNK